jgi:hypothetical protein
LPFMKISVLAVPRSMAMSLETRPNRDENMRGDAFRTAAGRDSRRRHPGSSGFAR